jgi:hypothetical protein
LHFENWPKGEKIPFVKEVDSGIFGGQNELLLGPSEYKPIPLAFQFLSYAFLFVFEGVCSPKKRSLSCIRAVQGQPVYVLR